jgi:hypothetical protein
LPLQQREVDEPRDILTFGHPDPGELRDSYAGGWVANFTFLETSLNGTPLPITEFWNLHATIVALGEAC